MLNKKEKVNLLLDTGASRTLITPDVANLLEINPPENTETHRLNLVGGKTIDIPFVNLEEIRVGEAVVKDLGVGVSTIFPDAYLVDGLLGADFLNHFLFTVDRNNSRMILKPQKVTRPVRSLEKNAVLSAILLSLTDRDKFAANIKDRPIYKYLKDEFNPNFEQEKKIETLFMRADFELKRACDPGEKKRDLDKAWEDYFLKIAGGLKSILNDEQRSKLALEIKAAQEALDKADESERTWIADKYGINDLSRFSKKMKEAADSYL